MENKYRKLCILLGIVSFIIILGLVGYILYDKGIIFNNNQTNQNNNNKEDKKPQEISLEDKENILKKINYYNKNFYSYYPINDISKISNQDLIKYAIYVYSLNSGGHVMSDVEEVSASVLDDIINSYFKDLKIKHEDYIDPVCGKVLYKYSDGKYKYDENHLGHGDPVGTSIRTLFDSATILDNEITFNARLMYSNYIGDIGMDDSYYKSLSDSKNNSNPLCEFACEEDGDMDACFEKFYSECDSKKDTLPITTYKFIKDGSNYKLLSVSIK